MEEGAGSVKLSYPKMRAKALYKEPRAIRDELAALYAQMKAAEDTATVIDLQRQMNDLYKLQHKVYPILGKEFNPNAEREYREFKSLIPGLLDSGASESKVAEAAVAEAGSATDETVVENEIAALQEQLAAAASAEEQLAAASAAEEQLATASAEEQLAAAANAVADQENSSQEVIDPDVEKLRDLENRIAECDKSCNQLKKERQDLIEIRDRKIIEGLTFAAGAKLIDLLVHRILDPDPNWYSKIETLINIPHSLSGVTLRGGDYFEALFQLAIAIGILPQFRDKYVRFYDIRNYRAELTEMKNYLYTKTIQNSGGREQGVSDITFSISSNPEFKAVSEEKYKCGQQPVKVKSQNERVTIPMYFISVKGYKKEKSIKDAYDIPLLGMQLNVLKDKVSDRRIIVCVRNKEQFMANLGRSKIDFLKQSINFVIGFEEVMEAFTQFRINFFLNESERTLERINARVRQLFPQEVVQKPILSLYFHQELVAKAVIERIKEGRGDKPHFMCIGVLPRGGKSFIAGGIIDMHRKLLRKAGGYNVLFLTSAVNETVKQFKEDLINKFSDFRDFSFVDVRFGEQQGPVEETDARKPNKFYFISRQLASLKVETSEGDKTIVEANILEKLIGKLGALPSFDICFFDEAHVGIMSPTVRQQLQRAFDAFKIPIIMLTATYRYPAMLLDSSKDLFIWDLGDIKDMKMLPEKGIGESDIIQRYGALATQILDERVQLGESLETIAKPYRQFPNPNFISLTFAPPVLKNLLDTEKAEYSITKHFEINPNDALLQDVGQSDQWHTLLRNREHALRLREFLTPEESEGDAHFLGADRRFRALNQIFAIAQKNGGRPTQGVPFSMIMFLPFGEGIRIGELCRIWASFMRQVNYWRENFVFLTLSEYSKHQKRAGEDVANAVKRGLVHREDISEDLKSMIQRVEHEALKQNKGLVLLTGDVAKMGISLPCVDVVMMMTDSKDPDDIIQKMYRALTDDPPHKKDGFIVDLNIKRIIRAFFDYDEKKDTLRKSLKYVTSVEDRLTKIFELCNWGYDSFIEENAGRTFDDVMNDVKKLTLNSLEKSIKRDIKTPARDVIDNQIAVLKQSEYWEQIQEALEQLIFDKMSEKTKAMVELMSRGSELAAAGAGGAGAGAGGAPPANAAKTRVPARNEYDLWKRIRDLIQTFISALVIKSSESLNEKLNIKTLLARYYKDKEALGSRIPSCECGKDCSSDEPNLYEDVWCAMRPFSIDQNPLKLKLTLNILEIIFQNPLFEIEGNRYIEELQEKLISANSNLDQEGGSKKKRVQSRWTRKRGTLRF